MVQCLYRLERGSAYPEAADPAVVLLLLPAQARQTRMLQAHAASVHPQGRRFAYRLHLVDSGGGRGDRTHQMTRVTQIQGRVYVVAGGEMLRMGAVSLRASRKRVVSLVARRRGRTLCQDVAGESSRKGPVSLQAARHHLEAEPIQR